MNRDIPTAKAYRRRLLQAARRQGAALALAGAVLAVAGLPAPARLALRFERDAVLSGELWRLLTAHLVHTGAQHLALNLTTLGLLVLLAPRGYWRCSRRRVLEFTAVCGLLTLGLLASRPDLGWYLGLSGAAHGLLVLVILELLRHHRLLAIVLASGLAAKLAVEQLWGAPASTAALVGAPVIVDSHLLGALAGLLTGITARIAQRLRRRAPPPREGA
ncbi:MAG TPA: rhombosortase [Pseudohaliea sp.]|nr:rhombosortase [Pseudohaliea sp.]